MSGRGKSRPPGGLSITVRRRIRLRGFVQGVGFRPHVYNLALALGLRGFVVNTNDGAEIEVQGELSVVETFTSLLKSKGPPRARILDIKCDEVETVDGQGFNILASRHGGVPPRAMVSPDLALCPACLAEMGDPDDRRFRYPFINCTGCGPRFTIIGDLPYDRPATTMAAFVMCGKCRREYENPVDRRFHAQPNACPDCGPRVELCSAAGERLADGDAAVTAAVGELSAGMIVAVKGIGGFHLAVNGRDNDVVARLRRGKQRPGKPFALMARDLDAAATIVRISRVAREALCSSRAPIVLLPRLLPDSPCPGIAPGLDRIGVMLPYTPLHHLLFTGDLDLLVMTSGNISGEPIIIVNDKALRDLGGIADFFLVHNRDILVAADDSVEIEAGGGMMPLRRSRGHVLRGIKLAGPGPSVLGVGGEMKNAVCLLRDDIAFPGPHVGDIKSVTGLNAFLDSIKHLKKILAVEPEAVACDLHPDYLSSRWAGEESGLPLLRVQHHHAHFAACLAENHHSGPAVGLILDGTGLGGDNSIWGGEILVGDCGEFVNAGGLSSLLLAGGDRAVLEPWRIGVGYLYQAGGVELMPPWLRAIKGRQTVCRAIDAGINTPRSSSCGRLFDAVAALCGFCLYSTFDAEAPMRLLGAADYGEKGGYPFVVVEEGGRIVVDSVALLLEVARDIARGRAPGRVSARFHRGLACGLVMAVTEVCRGRGLDTVVLSGGVFANDLLSGLITAGLERERLQVLRHRQLPPGDGCLAVGQAVVARRRLAVGLNPDS